LMNLCLLLIINWYRPGWRRVVYTHILRLGVRRRRSRGSTRPIIVVKILSP